MRKDRCPYACWGVAKTLGTKWVNNQLINASFLKVAYCEFQLDLQCYFHCFSLAKQIIVYQNLWFIFVGQPIPMSVVICRQHCLASKQTVEATPVTWGNLPGSNKVHSQGPQLSFCPSWLGICQSRWFFPGVYIFKPWAPVSSVHAFLYQNLIIPVMQALTLCWSPF